jgi:transposase
MRRFKSGGNLDDILGCADGLVQVDAHEAAALIDADWIRALVTKRRARANIPPRSNRTESICLSPHLCRARNLVERFFSKIKQCRRVATRYDKLAANYLAFIQLASIRLWLRVNEFTS